MEGPTNSYCFLSVNSDVMLRRDLLLLLILVCSPYLTRETYLSCTGWYLYYGTGHCYKVFCDRIQFHEAQKFCEEGGGYLASIKDAAEQDFVHALLLGSLQVNDSWIGYYRAKYRGPFLWVDKSPKKFELWAPREPNNRDLYEACTYIEDSGKWGDLNCYNIKNFICERESCRDLPN